MFPQFSDCNIEALLCQNGEMRIHSIRRILFSDSRFTNSGAECTRLEIQMMSQKFIWMLYLKVKSFQFFERKMRKVLSHDYVASTN